MYSNRHLKEVVCTFKFIQGSVKWDSAFFGQYFDKIIGYGFTERQEKKGIVFQFNPAMGNQASTVQEGESQMIFRNPEKNYAITMGNQFISFHIVSTYKNWEVFNEKLMKPFMEKYIELGIYEKLFSCQLVYLNSFGFSPNDNLSEYFMVISNPLTQFGREANVQVAKNYITHNGIILNLRITPQPAGTDGLIPYMLECGATGTMQEGADIKDWQKISSDVRQPVRDFFESIITHKLRGIL
ncbi:TIGR04255 family protein [Pedobacter terrae]|uniref:TIGR04255 family protein n=1 Tax=Pedobacter terrae TaxID=405671 RepID=A0A1G8ELN7_9SPHI|nr:TIGR04255 family protein [Pedobacter terrae]SDH70780.1 TIGR04255 family protein [Pedobacter terrae]